MTTEVPLWSFERLSDQLPGNACVWTTARFAERAGEKFGREVVVAPIVPSPEAPAVVVVGGGTLIDRAKVWRQANEKDTALFAVPSIWGSGAENSPVAVINGEEEKQIFIGPEYLPDARMVWPELAREASEAQRRNACGDAWSHALEGFFSPIASREVRLELASVIDGLTRLSAEDDPGWFESSARACAGQARSSVGLIHGIPASARTAKRWGTPRSAGPSCGRSSGTMWHRPRSPACWTNSISMPVRSSEPSGISSIAMSTADSCLP